MLSLLRSLRCGYIAMHALLMPLSGAEGDVNAAMTSTCAKYPQAVSQGSYSECLQGLERHADPKGEVAKNFRVRGFEGSVSFVTSMTQAFCGDCNRLRLMADGNLKVMLHVAAALCRAEQKSACIISVVWVRVLTQAFCGDCNRLRLMADGNLKVLLHAVAALC